MLAPARFASPAKFVNAETSQSTPAVRSRSLEFFNDKYSATSLRPASRALRSASDKAAAHASSSSLIIGCRWYHERRTRPPTDPDAEPYRNDPIISNLKATVNGDSSSWFVSADHRQPTCPVKQITCAIQLRERFCRSYRRRNQDSARKPTPEFEREKQDRF